MNARHSRTLVIVDMGNRTRSGPYEGFGIIRSMALKVVYEGVRQDAPLRCARGEHGAGGWCRAGVSHAA